MKKVILSLIIGLAFLHIQAQSVLIYTNDGHCELVKAAALDALYPVAGNYSDMYAQFLDGRTIALDYNTLDSIVVTNRTMTVSTLDAINVARTSATISGSVDWNIPATVGFLVSENNNPTFENSNVVPAEYGNAFSATLEGLTMTTTYYYKAFAYLSGEYYYGSTKSFTTTGYAVGDLYPDAENPIGVVYLVTNNGTHGKIVSLTSSSSIKWDSRNWLNMTSTGGTSTTDGAYNFSLMSYTYHPVKTWIVDNLGAGWYCPAKGELVTIANNIQTVNNTLTSNGYQALECFFYWSSTEYSLENAYMVCVGGSMGYPSGWSAYVDKEGNSYPVLGVKQF